jgi:hypothetical protein
MTSRGRRHSGTPVHITPPGTGVALEDGDPVPLAGELAGDGQAVGAGADDRSGEAVRRRRRLPTGLAPKVGRDPLQIANTDRGVDFLAAAGVFTRAGAHPAEATGEDVVLLVQFVGIGVAAVCDEGDVARNVGVGRASGHARDVVGEPLGISGVDGVALAGPLDEGGVEGGVDEGEQADPATVLDVDVVVALAGDAVRGEIACDGIDLAHVHGPEAVRCGAARGARGGRRGSLVDPPADLATEHGRDPLPAKSDRCNGERWCINWSLRCRKYTSGS